MTRIRRRDEHGSAVVDFVLVAVVLLPMVIGILQLTLVLHVRNTLASAAAEGARVAAVSGSSPAHGEQRARQQITQALSADLARNVRVRRDVVRGAPGYEAVIEAEVPVLGLGGPAMRVRVSGHAIAEVDP